LHDYYASLNKKSRFDFYGFVDEVIDKGPVLYFCFSRKDCEFFAKKLSKKKYKASPDISLYVQEHLRNYPDINSLDSVKLLRSCLPKGIGFHHAGLLPVIKDLVEDLFSKGMIRILFTTETFAVGINMPAKTVCFNSIRKFDGINFRYLFSREFYQIAGRAGRRGIDKEGFVVVRVDPRDFDYHRIRKMLDVQEPVRSKFRLSYNSVLMLINEHSRKEIDIILKKSFYAFSENKSLTLRFRNMSSKLSRLGFLEDNKLTDIGVFASKLFCDEITTSKIFFSGIYGSLSPFELCLLLGSLCYESRSYKKRKIKRVDDLLSRIQEDPYLANVRKFNGLYDVFMILKPCFDSENFFEVLDNCSLQEGDLLRFLLQVVDRLKQVRNALDDSERDKILFCERTLLNTVQNISVL
jgi:superfamily II RNA helicase